MEYIKNIREKRPLVHSITNYVTVNDLANILLAIGASPIMADAIEEMEDIAQIADALNINIGTLNKETVEAMHLAGKFMAKYKKVIVLDPVGAGASAFRTNTARDLIDNIPFDVIKGNISEIKALFGDSRTTCGVDANEDDLLTEDKEEESINFIKKIAQNRSTILVVTGKRDIITDGKKVYLVDNGCEAMKNITGSGCMLSGLIAAFVSANKSQVLEATLAAVITMGIAGERAFKNMKTGEGNFSYRGYILDVISNINDEVLEREASYELR